MLDHQSAAPSIVSRPGEAGLCAELPCSRQAPAILTTQEVSYLGDVVVAIACDSPGELFQALEQAVDVVRQEFRRIGHA
eukprot:9917252-Alexandrium_andersonii.AAC.1